MLIVVIMFGVLISDFSKDIVYADSNTIRKTMIQFYKGNSIHDIEGTDWQKCAKETHFS